MATTRARTRRTTRASATADDRLRVLGVGISHPDKQLWPDDGITKLDLARWYEAVAARMLPHVVDRPLTLVRCPDGVGVGGEPCHYMRHAKAWGPAPLARIPIREKTKVGEYLMIEDGAGIVALAQMNVLEIHCWNTRRDQIEKPDRLVFDLDPGPEAPWTLVLEGGFLLRDALAALGLQSWVKTTGGKGLHIVAPLRAEHDWSLCLAFAKGLVARIAEADARFTLANPKAGRERKVLLDYLRNNRTNTSVAAFSTRARAHAPVSMPIRWDEVDEDLDPAGWTLRSAPKRLRAQRRDPWQDYWTCAQRLDAAALRALGVARAD